MSVQTGRTLNLTELTGGAMTQDTVKEVQRSKHGNPKDFFHLPSRKQGCHVEM